jgi:predicted nucleic acid-binding protein
MAAVSDTSPLNYLIRVELAEILPQLFAKVIIPPEVRAELLAPDAPTEVQGHVLSEVKIVLSLRFLRLAL